MGSDRGFGDDPVKVRSPGWALIQYNFVLVKRANLGIEQTHTHKEKATRGWTHKVRIKAER